MFVSSLCFPFALFSGEKHDEHNVQHEKHQAAYVVQFYVVDVSKDHSGYLEPIFDFLGFYLLTSAFDFFP